MGTSLHHGHREKRLVYDRHPEGVVRAYAVMRIEGPQGISLGAVLFGVHRTQGVVAVRGGRSLLGRGEGVLIAVHPDCRRRIVGMDLGYFSEK